MTYLPLALLCPPGIYLAHRTSNFVYSVRLGWRPPAWLQA